MKNYLKIFLLLALPFVAVTLYGLSDKELPSERLAFTKVDMQSIRKWWNSGKGLTFSASPKEETVKVDTLRKDTIKPTPIDTTHHRILFFGDSMLEGLSRRMRAFAEANGDTVTAVCWYSSTSEIWAKTDTLQYFIRKVRPTFVMICLCSNEQFVRDLPQRGKYIDKILQQLVVKREKCNKKELPAGKQRKDSTYQLPFIWIAPPSWKKDTGINDLIKEKVGRKRFFDSARLSFRRGSDHMHPTFSSSSEWMDSVAVWMQSQETSHPIRMQKPVDKTNKDGKLTNNEAGNGKLENNEAGNGSPKGKLRLILLQPYELTKK